MQKLLAVALVLGLAWAGVNANACVDDDGCENGTCDTTGATNVCDCTSGFVGETCQLTCPTECADVADCVATAGDAAAECPACNGNFQEPACTACAGNFAGDACDTCAGNFAGVACDECEVTHTGAACDIACPTGDDACDSNPLVCGVDPSDATKAACICEDDTKTGADCTTDCPTPACTGNSYCDLPDGASATVCTCLAAYFGDDCDEKKCTADGDEMCQNEGTCGDDFMCACATGYEGDRCETKMDDGDGDGAAGVAASLCLVAVSLFGVMLA